MADSPQSIATADPVREAWKRLVQAKRGSFPDLLNSFPELSGLLPHKIVSSGAADLQKAKALLRILDQILETNYRIIQNDQVEGRGDQSLGASKVMAAGAAIGRIAIAPTVGFDWSQPYKALVLSGREPSRETRRAVAGLWIAGSQKQNTQKGFKDNYEDECLGLLHDQLTKLFADTNDVSRLAADTEFIRYVYDGKPPIPESPSAMAATQPPRRRGHFMAAGASFLALAGAVTVAVLVWPSSSAPSKQAWSGPLPILIENATSLMDSVGSSFALPAKLNMTPEQLSSFSKAIYPNSDAFDSWYTTHDAIAVDDAFTTVTLRNTTTETVTIPRIKVSKNCQAPLSGTLFSKPTQGGPNNVAKMTFNLDAPDPIAQELLENGERGLHAAGAYFEHNSALTLVPGETMTVSLSAFTTAHDCTFTFQLLVATSKGTVTEDITDNGKKFEMTAINKSKNVDVPFTGYQAAYIGGPAYGLTGSEWKEVDPATYH